MRKLCWLSIVTLLSLVATGCGFHLRGAPTLPNQTSTVVVSSQSLHAPMERALRKQLQLYGLHSPSGDGSQSNTEQGIEIFLQPENLNRQLLSVYASGQVAEYELIFNVSYTVTFPDKQPLDVKFEVVRDYQDDPDQVLAKTRELELVLDEMRQEAADIIIRRLANQATLVAPIDSTAR